MKIAIVSAIAAAVIAGSATAALADGMDEDFYAIQRGEPYAGAAPVNHAAPEAVPGRRVFLNGYQPAYAVRHHQRRLPRKIEQ
ncbi:hypothetical protein [Labrys monachus]|uniref:Uncharacterized protein n=1 Tax=Labrys monachus TaxID=217067 RepID=A0ABU0FAN0_9HYPH|nr:hypothetical protein [Labrys monachus]MDQ0391674.1 hypothetical protein [Labrys monachus]